MKGIIAVVGGTGMLGKPVVQALAQANWKVRVLTRKLSAQPEEKGNTGGPAGLVPGAGNPGSIEFLQGSVEDPASLRKLMQGCDALHISLAGGPRRSDYDRVETGGVVACLRAAIEAGVKRITYLSVLDANENAVVYADRAKARAEKAIEESGLLWTIFRPTWFMDSLPRFRVNGKTTILGRQHKPLSWVAARDYAAMVTAALNSKDAENRRVDVLGPEPITMDAALRRYMESMHPDEKVDVLGIAAARFIGVFAGAAFRDLTELFAFFETAEERGDSELAQRLLGRPMLTLDQWLLQEATARLPPVTQ